ncbi:uncharacterized protein METZ01_LOCUS82978, partial [marine metagenome]
VIVSGLEPPRVDAEIFEEAFGDGAIASGIFERLGSAVAYDRAPVELELVAFRVTTEIIVVVEDQDTCVGMLLPIEVSSR